jgi:carboxypeptidase Q
MFFINTIPRLKNMKQAVFSLALLVAVVLQPVIALSQTSQAREEIHARIRKEATENSQIMKTLHVLTDLYGPRLTGSPSLKAAGEWSAAKMLEWGFDSAGLVPWEFGHPGWSNERAAGFILSPVKDSLVFEVLAWTPSTRKNGVDGVVIADTVNLLIPERPTREELNAYFETMKTKVNGRNVLVGRPAVVPVNFNPPAKRLDDEVLKRRFDPNAEPQAAPQGQVANQQQRRPGQLTPGEIESAIDAFLVANNAAVRINDAGREHGQIRAFNNRTFDVTKAVATVVMRNEDFGRIFRLLDSGHTVTLEFDIRNHSHPEGKTDYNVIADIKGSEFPDEVIMLGGHLDAWHAATGATDNAIGCAVMMEAARILKALGVKPRRTIRVALWSGEEQGLLGSQAYVKQAFGSFEDPKPGYEKFGGYFNIDSGTGRARGMSIFGPPEAATILREALASFSDLGFMGAISTRSRNLGGSDHTSFNQAGLPGIGVQQDPIEYFTHTWHTNIDTYERIVEDDVKASAIIIAAAVYELAMRDSLLPRIPAGSMPNPPGNR